MKPLILNSYALVLGICAALIAAEAAHTIFAGIGHHLLQLVSK